MRISDWSSDVCSSDLYAASMIAAWASRYLPPLVADLPQMEVAQGVSASETGAGALQLEIRSGEHRLLADEPVSVGGLGSGMSPSELVAEIGRASCRERVCQYV